MRKRMEAVEVFVDESGRIVIRGEDIANDELVISDVRISPEQVDLIVRWLHEARDTLMPEWIQANAGEDESRGGGAPSPA